MRECRLDKNFSLSGIMLFRTRLMLWLVDGNEPLAALRLFPIQWGLKEGV